MSVVLHILEDTFEHVEVALARHSGMLAECLDSIHKVRMSAEHSVHHSTQLALVICGSNSSSSSFSNLKLAVTGVLTGQYSDIP